MSKFEVYKERIDKYADLNPTLDQLADFIEEVANDDDLTNEEYYDLYSMAMDILRR